MSAAGSSARVLRERSGAAVGCVSPRPLALLVACLALTMSPSATADQDVARPSDGSHPQPVVVEERPAAGEQCLVCRKPIFHGDIVEVRYKGRRFHVAESMLDELEADPDRYFASLQAHSALFDESAIEHPSASPGWLVFGFYVLAGLIAGAVCAYLALCWGLPPVRWFLAGLLGNVVAVGILLMPGRARGAATSDVPGGLAKIPATAAPSACPACGESNHPSATACSACGAALDPATEGEAARVLRTAQ